MYSQEIRICTYDVLPDGNIKPSSLQKYFQQIAVDDLSSKGPGYYALRERNLVFVIIRLALAIKTPIHTGDRLLLKTYPYKQDGIMFYRAFELYREEELVAVADTRWVLMNYKLRSLVRASEYGIVPGQSDPTVNLPDVPRRISQVGSFLEVQRTVKITECDENGHLNNCSYSDLLLDDAPVEILSHPIRTVQIIFESEAKIGDQLKISYQKALDGFTAVVLDTTTGKVCFSAAVTLDFSQK